ncbi:MAG: hypothetical protein ABSG53_05265 [Thermoguttaceae bacterium]
MSTVRPPLTADALPKRLAEVFRLLRTGRHICVEDGAAYRDLENDEERYQLVLEGLGYELVHHAHGFYYLKGGPSLTSRRLQAITFFLLVLFQDLEEHKLQDNPRGWVQTLTNRVFDIEKLPHFGTTQLRELMTRLGVAKDTLRTQVLGPLKSLGMISMRDEGRFRFRPPIYRFVDLTLEYADQDWAKTDFSGQPPQEQMGGESEQLHTAGNTDGEMEEEA